MSALTEEEAKMLFQRQRRKKFIWITVMEGMGWQELDFKGGVGFKEISMEREG